MSMSEWEKAAKDAAELAKQTERLSLADVRFETSAFRHARLHSEFTQAIEKLDEDITNLVDITNKLAQDSASTTLKSKTFRSSENTLPQAAQAATSGLGSAAKFISHCAHELSNLIGLAASAEQKEAPRGPSSK